MRNAIQFRLWGRNALFTDPVTKIGGEKCSYHIPTYEALKGITESIYWKPTFVWIIDRMRVMKRIRTQTKGMKPLKYSEGGNDLSIYNYLADVEYQVEAHFEWNLHRPEFEKDRCEHKHHNVAKRMLDRGGRRDIFLGTRECQGYVEPCEFGDGEGDCDDLDRLDFGVMFHGFDYPDEIGTDEFHRRFWQPTMLNGVVKFVRPEQCPMRKFVRATRPKAFVPGVNFSGLQEEGLLL
jgi:CRISPR-associated protein Cas5d